MQKRTKPPNPIAQPMRRRSLFLWAITFIAVALFVRLGTWQLARATDAEATIAAFAAQQALPISPLTAMPNAANTYQKVQVSGVWLTERPIIQDNITYQGQPGIELLYPFQTNWGVLLVNLGFRKAYQTVRLPTERVTITGRLAPKRARITLKPTPWDGAYPRVVQTMDEILPEDIREYTNEAIHETAAPLAPLQLHLSGEWPQGYTRNWQATHRDPDRHRAYALQWFLFAAIAAFLRLRFTFWPHKPKSSDPPKSY